MMLRSIVVGIGAIAWLLLPISAGAETGDRPGERFYSPTDTSLKHLPGTAPTPAASPTPQQPLTPVSPAVAPPPPKPSAAPTVTAPRPTNSAIVPPPPPPSPILNSSFSILNSPEPQDIERLATTTMSNDRWMLMYQPLTCLDTSLECVQKLQGQAIANSLAMRELNLKIHQVNSRIEAAKTNNQQSIELSFFEPALQVFLQRDTVVENGQSRKMGFGERVGQLFSNPGEVLGDLLGALGVPILRSLYGGNDAQRNRSIQITELTIKVAEMERIKTEIATKTRERVQQLIFDFDVLAREFQAEQAIVKTEMRSFKLYAITYGLGDGDTNTYLHRKEQLERSKLKVFKDWAKLRAQIVNLKNMVVPHDW
jgi:hypothetical protein